MAKGIKGRALIVNRNEHVGYRKEWQQPFGYAPRTGQGTLIARCARCGEYFQVSTDMGNHTRCARGLIDRG